MGQVTLGAKRTMAALAAALVLCAMSTSARADEDTDPEDDEVAKELFYEGEDHYAAGRYEEAARKYAASYRLSKRPALLFNMGNAYERNGDYRKAVRYLKRYLKSPKARDVASVKERIRRIEGNIEAREKEEAERRELERLRKEREEAKRGNTGPPDDRRTRGERTPYYFLAGGAAAILTGGGFALAARSSGQKARSFCMNGLCTDGAKDDLSKEKTFSIVADVSFVAGAALVGVGVYMLVTAKKPVRNSRSRTPDPETDDGDDRDGDTDTGDDEDDTSDEDSLTVAPAIGPGFAGISLGGRF